MRNPVFLFFCRQKKRHLLSRCQWDPVKATDRVGVADAGEVVMSCCHRELVHGRNFSVRMVPLGEYVACASQ